MGIAYDPTIPSTGGRPSAQYLDIRDNFASIQTLIDIDHVDFSSPNYGKHAQMTLANVASPAAQADPQSVVYTKVGVASPATPDLTFRNQNGVFIVDVIRAYVLLSAGAVDNSQSFNVAGIVAGPAGSKDITFSGVTGQHFGVLGLNVGSSTAFSYSIIGNATIRVSANSLTSTIIILQV